MLLSVAVKDVRRKARKVNSHNPNRVYVVAYIGPSFSHMTKGIKGRVDASVCNPGDYLHSSSKNPASSKSSAAMASSS